MNTAYYQDEQEHEISATRAFRALLPLLKPHRKRLAGNLSLMIIATAMAVVGPVLVQQATDIAVAATKFAGLSQGALPPDAAGSAIVTIVGSATQAMWICAIAFLLTFLTGAVIEYFQRVHLEIIGQDVITALKRRCFDHLMGLSISFFDKNPVGRLLSRVESDGESLRRLFANIVVMVVRDVMLLFGMLTVMFIYNWKLTLVVLCVAPIAVWLVWLYQRYTTPRFLQVRRRMADIVAGLTEFLQGMPIIQVFNRQATIKNRVRELNRLKFVKDAETHVSNVVFFNIMYFLRRVVIAAVVLVGAQMILTGVVGAGESEVTAGVVIAFIMYIERFFEPIYNASDELHVLQQAIAGARRIFALLNNTDRIVEPKHPITWKSFEDVIRFENVSFSYGGDDNYAVRDVSFEIRKGEKVALVGMTGGGKSTIINLLLRFYDRTRGSITADGIDIRDIEIAELRSKFGLVLQDIFLFPGNIRENITLEHESITDESLYSTTKIVSADRFIDRLPDRFDTEVAERGGNLSRGERQLLSFARAMVFNPQVLLLDEATSSVDPDTERRIQTALKRLLRGRTSVIIAHRLSTILDADKILVVRNGEIIERGSHPELLAYGGYYEKLFRLQFMKPEKDTETDVDTVKVI